MFEFNLQYLKFYINLAIVYLDSESIIKIIVLNTQIFSNLGEYYLNKVNIENNENLKGPNKVINEKDYRLALEVYQHIRNNMNSICVTQFHNNNLIYAKKLALQMRYLLSESHIFLYMKGQYLNVEKKWIYPEIPDWWYEMTTEQLVEQGYCCESCAFGIPEQLKVRKLIMHDWSIMIAVPFTSIVIKYFNSKLYNGAKLLNTYCNNINSANDLYNVFHFTDSDYLKKNNLIDMKLNKVKLEFDR